MNEIKCPNCGKVFSVDEASYASVVSQIRTKEFEKDLDHRIEDIEKQQELLRKSERLQADQVFQKQLVAKDQELEKKNTEIVRLQEQLKGIATTKQAEYERLLAAKDAEILQLKGEITQGQGLIEVAVLKEQNKANQIIQQKDGEISSWKERLEV
jgi:hypothetical protein